MFRPAVSEPMRFAVGVDQLVIRQSRYVEAHVNAGITSRANSSSPDESYAASVK
jgi:hypothetical protein